MHAIPEKLSALRQNIEGTMTRQMADQRLNFERQLKDQAKDAEDTAVRRAEDLLKPQIAALNERLQAHLKSLQLRIEDAFPKIAEVGDVLAATRTEMKPLHARADAAAARLDRLAIQTSTTTKDCNDLGQDFRDVACELRQKFEEETRQRLELQALLDHQFHEGMQAAAAATRSAMERADAQARQLEDSDSAIEERLVQRLDEQALRSRKESMLGDEELAKILRPEIQAVATMLERRAEECNAHAEELVRQSVAKFRDELETSAKRVLQNGETALQQRARDLLAKMNENAATARADTEKVHAAADTALHEATVTLRKFITDTRTSLTAEAESLRQNISNVQTTSLQESKDAERKAIEASTTRLQTVSADLDAKINSTMQHFVTADGVLREDIHAKLTQATAKLERGIEEMGNSSNTTTTTAVTQAVTHLNALLAEALQKANERTDDVRKVAADSLEKEVQARKAAVMDATAAREALGVHLREEIRSEAQKSKENVESVHAVVSKRVDASNDHLRSVERSLEAHGKEQSDNHESVKSLLRIERQRTEETAAEHATFITQVRDNHESTLRAEVTEIRSMLADCRKRIYEESNALRSELREQPTKKEVVEVAATATGQYNELVAALDGHRSRLEGAVADFATRCREVRNESGEARLRMQRETIALGTELSVLRQSSTSLAQGVLKAMQVIGFIQEEFVKSPTTARAGGHDAPHKSFEVDDLLEWEKVGKSLATRISRNWFQKESNGSANLVAMIDQKADIDEILELKHLIAEKHLATTVLSDTNTRVPDRSHTVFPPITPKISSGESPYGGRKHRNGTQLLA